MEGAVCCDSFQNNQQPNCAPKDASEYIRRTGCTVKADGLCVFYNNQEARK